MTAREEERWRWTDLGEAGNPSSREADPLRSHSHGPLGSLLGSTPPRATLGRPDTRTSWRRHSRMGRGPSRGPAGLGFGPILGAGSSAVGHGAAAACSGEAWSAACASTSASSCNLAVWGTSAGRLPAFVAAMDEAILAPAGAGHRSPKPRRRGDARGRRWWAIARNSPKVGDPGMAQRAANSSSSAAASSSSSATSAHRRPRIDAGPNAPPGEGSASAMRRS